MKDVKGNGFWLDIKRFGTRDNQQDSFTRLHLVTGLHHLFVNSDMPVFN
jgi:hypothetical protein